MAISFGTPGRPRKSILDNKFELVNGNYVRTPAKLDVAVPASAVRDGLFVAISADGDYVAAPDAKRSLRMIFTGDTQRMNMAYEPRVEGNPAEFQRPGVDPSDTVTGLMGDIEGIWPAAVLAIGPAEAVASVNDFGLDDALTVKNGMLAKAVDGDEIIGRVNATAATLGSAAIQAVIHVR